jgi:hypothetical protein
MCHERLESLPHAHIRIIVDEKPFNPYTDQVVLSLISAD